MRKILKNVKAVSPILGLLIILLVTIFAGAIVFLVVSGWFSRATGHYDLTATASAILLPNGNYSISVTVKNTGTSTLAYVDVYLHDYQVGNRTNLAFGYSLRPGEEKTVTYELDLSGVGLGSITDCMIDVYGYSDTGASNLVVQKTVPISVVG